MSLLHQIAIGTGMIILCVFFHVGGLVYLSHFLRDFWPVKSQRPKPLAVMGIVIGSMLIMIALHSIEAWLWAGLYIYIGEFNQLSDALYFSTVTSTTLGYGDIVLSDSGRLLSGFESMGGLLLFGVTTAFLIDVIRYLMKEHFD
ncbi:two pore domain potassium channel family protein [Shewanella sp. 202IG2-18]|uniref:potassium channel family protein n=1 Tax=Parashewanella hymeniacidonis TaxID=2807618 RepID=UPI0019611587|nr:potassium channel family protein [Parashewanella hymeniacidonis]MBM7072389.1 two pore domain potassium channel family protein [Parashewanella hymeniacidonis]